MRLAKNHVDVGLLTNRPAEMLAFWQGAVGLPFEELLPVGGGIRQHRYGMNGSVLKLNEVPDPLPDVPPGGYRTLTIARTGLSESVELADPDGNRVRLVPPGTDGITGIEIEQAVRSAPAFHQFYGVALGLETAGTDRYRCGDSLIRFREDPAATPAGEMRAPGYRYLTVQVWDVDAEHAGFLARGVQEGQPPRTLGTTARVSFIRDPDGNWIEVSQRASLTGPVPGA